MQRHITTFLAAMAMTLSNLPKNASPGYLPPANLLSPQGLGVVLARRQDARDNFTGFEVTSSLPDDLRQLASDEKDENSAFRQAGCYNLIVKMQLDFKIDSGSWHYDSSWDAADKTDHQDFSAGIGTDADTSSVNFHRDDHFEVFYPGAAPMTKSYFQNHIWTFRTRYVVQYTGSDGKVYYVSAWSSEVTYPSDVKRCRGR